MYKYKRLLRHKKVRKNIFGTKDRPRLAVFKSNQHIYAQVIDDSQSKTLVSMSDLSIKEGTKIDKAVKVGIGLAQKAIQAKIKQVVFDRGGFVYHGRVAALAKAAREGGLVF